MPDLATLLERVRDRKELPPPSLRRAIREAAGLSLDALATSFDPPVSRSAVHHWEVGDRFPRPRHLQQYAERLRALQEQVS